MNEKYNALFTPWKIGNVEIKNRIVQCSMGGTSLFGWMEPNHFDKEAAYFLLNRAQDGVGLILPGMQCIRDPLGIPGRKWLYQNDQMFKQLKEYMVEFHKTGAKLFIQLAAGMGRSMAINGWMTKLAKNNVLNKIASPIVDVQYICASASEVPNRWKEDVMSRPLTVKEIEDMVYAFGQTAKKLRAAGVDGVEIHAVHEGYLLDQFTMANWNHRTDKYGGSFENRFRFPVEIVQEIKRQAGADFPVSLRYSVVSKTKAWGKGAMPYETDFVEFGRDMAESEKAVKYLEDAGYDMFNCDNGTYDAWYWAHPPQYMPDNCNLEYVEHIKKFTSRPVVCAGRMDPVKAAEEIAAGRLPENPGPIQSGVGSVGNAVLSCLASSGFHGLSMYTEVMQDSALNLIEQGVFDFVSTSSIALGEENRRRFYENIDFFKDKILLRPQEITNHPEVVRRLGVISLNTPIEVDIYGNVNSTHIMGTKMMNGIGGSGDFARNARVCIFATESVAKGGLISCIVPMVSHVDQTEHDVQVIITEQGIADLRWKTPRERAELIIENCAHPDYRPMLREYYEHALDVAAGKQTPHDLAQALSWHQRFLATGTMKP